MSTINKEPGKGVKEKTPEKGGGSSCRRPQPSSSAPSPFALQQGGSRTQAHVLRDPSPQLGRLSGFLLSQSQPVGPGPGTLPPEGEADWAGGPAGSLAERADILCQRGKGGPGPLTPQTIQSPREADVPSTGGLSQLASAGAMRPSPHYSKWDERPGLQPHGPTGTKD